MVTTTSQACPNGLPLPYWIACIFSDHLLGRLLLHRVQPAQAAPAVHFRPERRPQRVREQRGHRVRLDPSSEARGGGSSAADPARLSAHSVHAAAVQQLAGKAAGGHSQGAEEDHWRRDLEFRFRRGGCSKRIQVFLVLEFFSGLILHQATNYIWGTGRGMKL